MKIALKAIFALITIVFIAFLFFYYTDIFYPKTKFMVNVDKIEVLISRLTTEEELNSIKAKLNRQEIKLIIKNATFSDDHIKKISVKVIAPYAAEGEYSSENMRFSRYFIIELNSEKETLKIGNDKSDDM